MPPDLEPQLPGASPDLSSGAEPSLPYRLSAAARAAFERVRREHTDELDQLEALEAQIIGWPVDSILAELRAMPTLPFEADVPAENLTAVGELYDLFRCLAGAAALHRMREAVPLLLDRICYSEPGEYFRSYIPSWIAGAAGNDCGYLVGCCVKAIQSGKRGSIHWAINVLCAYRTEAAETIRESAVPLLLETVSLYREYNFDVATILDAVGIAHSIKHNIPQD